MVRLADRYAAWFLPLSLAVAGLAWLISGSPTRTALVERLVPHEEAEEAELYPALARTLGGGEAVAPMSRAHAEIGRLTRRLQVHLDALDAGAVLDPGRRQDLLACLYGLHALLLLHYLQEEESYFALAEE